MIKALGFALVLTVGFTVNPVMAKEKNLPIFSCQFEKGGSVKITRDSKEVTLTVVDSNKKKNIIKNPLNETGVGVQKSVDGREIAFLDILEGDIQYSIQSEHPNNTNVARLAIMDGNMNIDHRDCIATTVKDNLQDPASIAGIFRP